MNTNAYLIRIKCHNVKVEEELCRVTVISNSGKLFTILLPYWSIEICVNGITLPKLANKVGNWKREDNNWYYSDLGSDDFRVVDHKVEIYALIPENSPLWSSLLHKRHYLSHKTKNRIEYTKRVNKIDELAEQAHNALRRTAITTDT